MRVIFVLDSPPTERSTSLGSFHREDTQGLILHRVDTFMLVLEATFGLAGLLAAPIIYAQIKRILADRGWVI